MKIFLVALCLAATLASLVGCDFLSDDEGRVYHIMFTSRPETGAVTDLHFLDTESRRKQRLTDSEYDERLPAVSPDGKWIAYTEYRNEIGRIWIMDGDGTDKRPAPIPLPDASGPRFSPDGQTLAFIGDPKDGSMDIYTVRLDGANFHRLTTDPFAEALAGFSPNGERVLYAEGDVFTQKVDGADLINVTNSPEQDREPHFSPDGSRIVYTSRREHDEHLFLIDADGGNVVQLTNMEGMARVPHFSPDGGRIVFTHTSPPGPDPETAIYTIEVSGGALKRLTPPGWDVWEPVFSPDGRKIAFHRSTDDQTDIWIMDSDGSDPRNLTDSPSSEGSFVFLP